MVLASVLLSKVMNFYFWGAILGCAQGMKESAGNQTLAGSTNTSTPLLCSLNRVRRTIWKPKTTALTWCWCWWTKHPARWTLSSPQYIFSMNTSWLRKKDKASFNQQADFLWTNCCWVSQITDVSGQRPVHSGLPDQYLLSELETDRPLADHYDHHSGSTHRADL